MLLEENKKLEKLVTKLQIQSNKLIDPKLRPAAKTPRDILQELSVTMQKIAMLVITEKSGQVTINWNPSQRKYRLTLADWQSSYRKRSLGVRLPVELLVFLDQYAGFGNRSALIRRLLWSFRDRKESVFIDSIERGKELEEENQKRKQAEV